MTGLPDAVRALAELSPLEDLILAILQPRLTGVEVKTLIRADQDFPLVLIRRGDNFGTWAGDMRFTDAAQLNVHCFCADPDGDEDAAILSEAVRVILRDAWLTSLVIPGRGHLLHLEMQSAPRRATDWATATGPVQYADLPTGVHRYETRFNVAIRKPRTRPYPPP
ncbi:hypothetical protein [Kribbella deserti]|uniref:Tail terminator n=1 Tax=Kribbella deserti TaxID=1926257 RepID=A0ABV6QGF6_9ACTN